MFSFNSAGKAPGVYIFEETVPGPIPGVSTSVAAFIGPAQKGPINEPTFITNWTQFVEKFGQAISSPLVYAAHSVRGFFENGGTACYFVRVGKAKRASIDLFDCYNPNESKTLSVTAKKEGSVGNSISAKVQDAYLGSTTAHKGSITLVGFSQTSVTAKSDANAAKFLSGDVVLVQQGSVLQELTIKSIQNSVINFYGSLVSSFKPIDEENQINLRIADIKDRRSIRIESVQGFEPGSYVKLSQEKAQGSETITVEENGVVESVDSSNKIIVLKGNIQKSFSLSADDSAVNVRTLEFTLKIAKDGQEKAYEKLSMEPYHSRYFKKIIDSELVDVTLADPPSPAVPPLNLPDFTQNSGPKNLEDGTDENIAGLGPTHYKKAIDTLTAVDDVNILCVPDNTSQEVQSYLISHCELMKNRFAILDAPQGAGIEGIKDHRKKRLASTSYAALYFPWIYIDDSSGTGRIKIPPSGYVAGVYARTDDTRGVHKAPANESIRGALGLEHVLTDGDQGSMNEMGINVLRSFPGRGVVIWGARTMVESGNTQWRYVNVRRLLIYIEESIKKATQFAVFEPNNPSLWATVKRQVTDFLTRTWRNGALFGSSPDQAFRVKVDEELNPPSVRALGQLIIEVVVFPVTPAEYVVFRIIQQPGGPMLNE